MNYLFYNNIYLGDWIFLLSDILWVINILILLCMGLYFYFFFKSIFISKLFVELSLVIYFVIFFFFFDFLNFNLVILDIMFLNNNYFFFRIFFLFFSFFILIVAVKYFVFNKYYFFEYPLLVFLSMEGSFVVIFSLNLFIIFLALELQNLSFYVLAALKRYNNLSTEAGLKYFLFGAFSSSLLLFGISILYGLYGTLDLISLNILFFLKDYSIVNELVYLSFFFILAGLLFKLGGFPFHWWVPDVYEGSPTSVMMLFSILPKLMLVMLLGKFVYILFFLKSEFIMFFFFLVGIFSILVGSINAMYQFKIKRFLAYSAIANVGFILVGLSTLSIIGVISSLIYIFCYIFVIIYFFIFFLNFNINKFEIFKFFEFSNIFQNNLLLGFSVICIFFSFVGLPPLIGFFGKFFIFFNLLSNSYYLILLIVLLLSVFIAFYYLRVIRFSFFNKIKEYKFINYIDYKFNSIFFSLYFFFNLFFFLFFDIFSEFLSLYCFFGFLI